MSHLDYYQYQTTARGIHSFADVQQDARSKAYLYDRIVLPWLPADKAAPIGELACGHGSFLWWLKERQFANLRGCDSSVEQIAMARQATETAELADVNQWLARQPDTSLAALVAIDLIEHLSKADFLTLLRTSHAALAPGGSLILRLPNGDSPFVGRNLFNDITHVWTYTPNCLDTLAAMHGFSRTEFMDEGAVAIRDHRWLKVPLAKLSAAILRALTQAATREKIAHLSPNLWARLVK